MKNLKSKIRDFLASEEGRVGVKTPLAIGVAAGGLLLAQVITSTPEARADQTCSTDSDCPDGQQCEDTPYPVLTYSWDPYLETWVPSWSVEWHETCQ